MPKMEHLIGCETPKKAKKRVSKKGFLPEQPAPGRFPKWQALRAKFGRGPGASSPYGPKKKPVFSEDRTY